MSDSKVFWSSVTRCSDFRRAPFECEELSSEHWGTGDFVLGIVRRSGGPLGRVELDTGRMTELVEGDRVLGALGVRYATLEVVGSWRDIGTDRRMQLMTAAGLIGRPTSVSKMLPPLVELEYAGHAFRDGAKLTMDTFVVETPIVDYDRPTVLCVGTSMSSGKTTAAKAIIRTLKQAGLRVVGCKLTGAARYQDVLAMRDAGADEIFDFVDAGLPSSIADPDDFAQRLRGLLSRIQQAEPDVVVAEAGASPLEPYNGETVVATLGDTVRWMVLCASDPYAVIGVMRGFERRPDLVAGVAASTTAGIELIERLTGLRAINVLEPEARESIRRLIVDRL